MIDIKVSYEDIKKLDSSLWFDVLDEETLSKSMGEVNHQKFLRYLSIIGAGMSTDSWYILQGQFSSIQLSIKALLLYLTELFEVKNFDNIYSDYLRFFDRLKQLGLMVELECQYCLIVWHFTYVDGLIKSKILVTLLRISYILRVFFKDVYVERNFKLRVFFEQLRLDIKNCLLFDRKHFVGEELELFDYIVEITTGKKIASRRFQNLVFKLREENQNFREVMEKMIKVLEPRLKAQQQLQRIKSYEEIKKNIYVAKQLAFNDSVNRNVTKKRNADQLLGFLRQIEKEEKEKQSNKLTLEESAPFDRGTKLTGNVGTKRGTIYTSSYNQSEVDVAEVQDPAKQKKEKKPKAYQFEKLNDCKSFYQNKDLNLLLKGEAFSLGYGIDFFKPFMDENENKKRKIQQSKKSKKEKEAAQIEEEVEEEGEALEKLTQHEFNWLLEIDRQAVDVTMDDVKGEKKTAIGGRNFQRKIYSEEAEGLMNEEGPDFLRDRKKQRDAEYLALEEHISKLVYIESAENENKEEKEKDRNIFYLDYAEDSDEEAEVKAVKAKKKAVVPYDWRLNEAEDDPHSKRSPFDILRREEHDPVKKMSMGESVRAKGWSRIKQALEVKQLIQTLAMGQSEA